MQINDLGSRWEWLTFQSSQKTIRVHNQTSTAHNSTTIHDPPPPWKRSNKYFPVTTTDTAKIIQSLCSEDHICYAGMYLTCIHACNMYSYDDILHKFSCHPWWYKVYNFSSRQSDWLLYLVNEVHAVLMGLLHAWRACGFHVDHMQLGQLFCRHSREHMQKWGESWTRYYISHRQYPTQAQCPAWNGRVIYKLNKYFMQILLCTISFKAGRASKWTQILCYCKKLFFNSYVYIIYD